MKVRGWAALGLALVATSVVRGQATTSATVEKAPLELKSPDRFQVPSVLEPVRRVAVMAPIDGILRTVETPGAAIREAQEIAQLDRAEATARLRIEQAIVKEMQAAVDMAKPLSKGASGQAEARLEAAQARADLAKLELDRCTLRAPFAGRLLSVPVSPGQYLAKGTTIADLADVSSLRVLVPIDRSSVPAGSKINVSVEGQVVAGKVQSVVPLPESLAALRELSTALSAAWVVLPNPSGTFEPGQRVQSSAIPTAPIATIPTQAVHQSEDREGEKGPSVQVIRNEYVTTVRVRVLGNPGPERVQVSGAFRPTDALIVSSSAPLLAGTLLRFGAAANVGAVEASSPNPNEAGVLAGVTPPGPGGQVAPIGEPGSALPKSKGATRPAPKPGTPKAAGSRVPF